MASNITRTFVSAPQPEQKPTAPYSSAVLVNQTLYVSGQLGLINHKTSQFAAGGAVPEAKQALENVGALLKAAGADYSNVVKATVYLTDFKDLEAVNNVYRQYFKNNYPARSTIQVVALPRGGKVEIEAIAVIGNITNTNSSQ